MSSSIVLNPQRNLEKKNNKKFGMFLRKKNKKNKKKKKFKISTKKKTKSNSKTKTKTKTNTKTKTKTGKIKMAFRKKLKGRSRKEKSAVTALFVLSTDHKQKKEEQLKKQQLLEKLENGLNSATSTEQGDQQYYLNLQKQIESHEQQEREQRQQQKKKEKHGQGLNSNQDEVIDLSNLRSLYTPYSKPTSTKQVQRQEPQKQELDCEFLRNRLGQQQTHITEDTTSTYDQNGEESYDDSLSEDLPSSSNEDFYGYPRNNKDFEIEMDMQCYHVSDDEMESLGDEIEIQFGSMQNEQNTHQLIFPEKISFVSSSYGTPTSYPKEYLFGKY
ncbi:hypothetical protein M0812_11124 [Anaeramoeba flamelloides]|uniref:Uncharacterized protein n=1 Tax=Anaeramoeba flamelloides TaxID=1746091 RepID=A0AAV7ZZ91_9EUKA|nr:hypothetical protein M0812_11124 [Anaeramoeba flamelloides]